MQTEIVTDPDAIAAALKPFLPRLRRVGHKAGSLSPWLQPELVRRDLPAVFLEAPAVFLEARHVRAAMFAQRNKTDATDALTLAHIVRTGWFRQAHIKTESCYRLRLLLRQRHNLKRKVWISRTPSGTR
jgi:transposase